MTTTLPVAAYGSYDRTAAAPRWREVVVARPAPPAEPVHAMERWRGERTSPHAAAFVAQALGQQDDIQVDHRAGMAGYRAALDLGQHRPGLDRPFSLFA